MRIKQSGSTTLIVQPSPFTATRTDHRIGDEDWGPWEVAITAH
jgi:hypothetical protein